MWLEIVILFLAVPVGHLIAYLARDELKQGKKYFRVLILLGVLGFVGFWIYGYRAESFTSAFIGIVALISFLKN